ncbi:protein translocase subunit SecF [Colwellia piezophila]|uniref:protein translocase subunit SecF n=1 Tax=Colwellia piezophila TaxID=211668 RepID=UPI0003640BBC|nr:protein translocase subunit SecF [Colwellia piezophila]
MNDLNLKKTDYLSKFRIISFYCAAAFMLFALLGLFSNGLKLGLDFTGGYLTEFSTQQSITQSKMAGLLTSYLPDTFQLSSAENGTYWSVQQADNDISLKGKAWLSDFSQQSGLTITPQDAIYIGSQVGEELINQGGLALLTSVIVILLYLSLRFEWRLAAGAVIALCHDVIIVLGLFAWFDISFDLTILASLLAIIGYSLNDSIIVGDRVREIMKRNTEKNIDTIINLAIKSTIVRTLITSGTTLATILAIWFFAGESLEGFSIALFSGILVGTFSSIAISVTVPQLLGLTADYYHKKEQDICQLP